MVGYKYTTEQEAINAQNLCNNAFNYPKNDSITENWVAFQFSNLDDFYYIIFDESIEGILGEPINFDVTYEEIN